MITPVNKRADKTIIVYVSPSMSCNRQKNNVSVTDGQIVAKDSQENDVSVIRLVKQQMI